MKKIRLTIILAALLLMLAACGGGKQGAEEGKLVVGASNTPHAIILEQAKPILEEQGIELIIEKYQDYVLPNKDLESGELDANYFQHTPYLNTQIADHGYDFEIAGEIHIEPIGVYSKKYTSLDQLPDGATILMSNSVGDHGRLLAMLESTGLIKLKEGVDKTTAELKDIVENPKNLTFEPDYEAALLPTLFNNNEGDALLINSNYAIDAGLNPLEDSIAIESTESPYANVVAVRKGDKDRKEVQALIDVLKSKEIQDFILEEWGGSVVPVDKK